VSVKFNFERGLTRGLIDWLADWLQVRGWRLDCTQNDCTLFLDSGVNHSVVWTAYQSIKQGDVNKFKKISHSVEVRSISDAYKATGVSVNTVDNVTEWCLKMTAGTESTSVDSEWLTVIWPTWHCQIVCSTDAQRRRPRKHDRRQLTAWMVAPEDYLIQQNVVFVDQAD